MKLYRQFKFDYSQLNDDKITEKLKMYYLDCLYNMASIYMALKDYFSDCIIYQQYIEQIDDNETKNKVPYQLMYIVDEAEDW